MFWEDNLLISIIMKGYTHIEIHHLLKNMNLYQAFLVFNVNSKVGIPLPIIFFTFYKYESFKEGRYI